MTSSNSSSSPEMAKHDIFHESDVLTSKNAKLQRLAQLLKAVTLESVAEQAVTIEFSKTINREQVTSRVLAAADDSVYLEGGNTIPIRRILNVTF